MSQMSAKLRQLRRIQIYDSPFWLFFLDFIPVDRAEISHMNGQQNLSRLPSQPGYRAHMKRPLVIRKPRPAASRNRSLVRSVI